MNRNDILYRSQYSANAMANLADGIATDIKNGDICQSKIKDFVILDMIMGTLICNIPRKEKLAIGQIEISNALINAQIATIKVNSVTINSGTINYGGSLPMFLQDIVDNINIAFSIPNYSAEVVPNTNLINIIADEGSGDSPNGFVITLNSTLITYSVISNMSGGINGQAISLMCLDEDKISGLFEYFSKNTGLCFNPINKMYNVPTVPTTTFVTIVTNLSDTIVTEQGYAMHGKVS